MGIDKVADGFIVSAYSEIDGSPHVIEWVKDERWMFGFLFHPEISYCYQQQYPEVDLSIHIRIFESMVRAAVKRKNYTIRRR